MKDDKLRILVPLDGSPTAETILPALMPLVGRQPTSLTLLQVIQRVDEIEASRSYLSRLKKDLERDGVEAAPRLEFGRPAEEILHLGQPKKHDLAAMTTHGHTGLRRALMGSVTVEVLRQSTIPLVLNRPDTKIGDWKRIVVALDGSVISEGILDEAIRLSLQLQATLHIVRVSLPLLPTTDLYFQAIPSAVEDPEPYLEGICIRLARRGILAVPVLREGFAGAEIVRYAAEIGAGLIAMMTEGKSGLPRLLSGSVAEEVLRSAPCPVLIRRWASVAEEHPVSAIHHLA
jgi:nucleotide-binding universal stress UspA family protein